MRGYSHERLPKSDRKKLQCWCGTSSQSTLSYPSRVSSNAVFSRGQELQHNARRSVLSCFPISTTVCISEHARDRSAGGSGEKGKGVDLDMELARALRRRLAQLEPGNTVCAVAELEHRCETAAAAGLVVEDCPRLAVSCGRGGAADAFPIRAPETLVCQVSGMLVSGK